MKQKQNKDKWNGDVRELLVKAFFKDEGIAVKELIELQHKFRIEEIDRESECRKQAIRLSHELELETQRIKNASIQRNIMAKRDREFFK